MTRKVIAMFLAVSMCLSISSVAFAAKSSNLSPDDEALAHVFDDSYWESVYVTLDDGSVAKVDIHFDTEPADSISPQSSLTPEHPVGTQKITQVKIRNDQIGAPHALGSLLSSKQKQTLANLATKAINNKAGIIIATAAKILAAISTTNAAFGNSGFVITTTWTYSAHFINSQGHNVYSWDLTKFNLQAY